MKTYSNLLLILFSFASIVTYSQNLSVNIGKSTTNSLTKSKSAQVIATFPENDTLKNSWLLDGFIELKINNAFNNYNFGVLSEFHKNNLTGKEQDVMQFGLTAEKDYLLIDSDDKLFFRIITSANAKYSNNRIKEKEEFQGNVGITLSLEKSDKLRFLQPSTRLIKINSFFAYIFTLSHNHNVGLGYIGGDEDILLGDAAFELAIYPFSRLSNKFKQPELFQLKYNIKSSTPIAGKTDIDINPLQSISAGFSYKINDKSSVGISYSWQEGANPYTRLEDHEFELLSAKLKLTIE